ncbi:Dbl homology domain-containing protein [Piromyces finnis]|uniref:Dbl homology domain-containing protein n=1 Tax=Piromyces finnis TaxID=1754191 RepID=A0A1Y1VNM8_9FUNG|nr:Dbl homology domain-containing protein [Piromyces finnis]|eukprot:ORX61017.1 Dbl homology domain-containing protein [Piromyces finnis]
MIESKIFSQEDIEKIFVNIKQILELHKNMVKSLNDLWRKMDDVMELEEELVKIYTDNLPKISTEYCVYCSNRAIGDEYLLNLYNEDPKTKKFITECENNNKVALDKLTLKDLLIEPMHRITRYSILFKRLSGYINYPLHPINTFLSQIDEETKKVNTAVGEMDSKQKVIKLEKILEWNNKFNIFCDKRKLYNIQEFQLIDKNGHNNEVVAYTFTDFILIVKMRKNIPILCIPPITYECCNIIDCFETAESAKSRTDKKNWLENIGLLKLSFCLSLYMSKNQPAILLKDDTGSITISDSSFESVASTTKKKFFSSLFEKSSGRRFSSVGTHSRKLSTASLDIDGKQKNMFLGKRFSVNIKRNSSFLSANEYIMNS